MLLSPDSAPLLRDFDPSGFEPAKGMSLRSGVAVGILGHKEGGVTLMRQPMGWGWNRLLNAKPALLICI